MHQNYIKSKKEDLESFDVWEGLDSYEETIQRISSFSTSDFSFMFCIDLLENTESDLLKIFEFFEFKVRKSFSGSLLYQKVKFDYFTTRSTRDFLIRTPKRKKALLFDLELLDSEKIDPKYRKNYLRTVQLYIDEFLAEAFFLLDIFNNKENEELDSILNNSFIKSIKNFSRNAFLFFVLAAGTAAFAITATKNTRYFPRSSGSPFATILQHPSYSASNASESFYPSTSAGRSKVKTAARLTPSAGRQNKIAKIQQNAAKEATNYNRVLRRNKLLDNQFVRIKQLGTPLKQELAANKITIPSQSYFSNDLGILVEKVNDFAQKVRAKNRVIDAKITIGQYIRGNLTGEVLN